MKVSITTIKKMIREAVEECMDEQEVIDFSNQPMHVRGRRPPAPPAPTGGGAPAPQPVTEEVQEQPASHLPGGTIGTPKPEIAQRKMTEAAIRKLVSDTVKEVLKKA